MNILHHKSWHVRNKDNIERVRRDEENAKKEEEEKLRRAALAESEARTELLRTKASKRQRKEDECPTAERNEILPATNNEHINFFKDLEEGKKLALGNVEYEKEKREEKEKQEKAIGLLTYLGQSSIESQVEKPWYLSTRTKRTSESKDDNNGYLRNEFNKKSKYNEDPMKMMNKYIDTKKKVEDKDYKPKLSKIYHNPSRSKVNQDEKESSLKKKHKRDKHRKHKKSKKKDKKKKKKKSSSDASSSDESQTKLPSKSIQQLRAERLKREQEERLKTKQLLKKLSGENDEGESSKQKDTVEYDDRKRTYNSLFNPELVRKPKRHKTDFLDIT